MDESLALLATDPRVLPSDSSELKLRLGTFCALTWSLYRNYFSHYQKLLSMRQVMDQGPLKAIQDKFTLILCRQIAWAVINNRRLFFPQRLYPDWFRRTRDVAYPESLLDNIIQDMRFARSVFCATFPQ